MLAASLDNENELLLLVAEGNEKAFSRLFDHYWNTIYSVAFALTKSSVLSEEIVQDVFLKIWLKRNQLPSIAKFNAYLFIVARNHIYNELRKKTVEGPFVEFLEQHFLETYALPEQQILLKETTGLIHKAVLQLPRQQRAVFELRPNEELNYTKIAEKLGISKLTVKSHMTKALHAIRANLQTQTSRLLFLTSLLATLLP